MASISLTTSLFYLISIAIVPSCSFAGDPYVFYDFRISYIIASPLGIPQQVIVVNGKFPGPFINATTNNNVAVNVWNDLDEDLLLTWPGIQMRHNSWQDGLLGTNCPIPPKWNWTLPVSSEGSNWELFLFSIFELSECIWWFFFFVEVGMRHDIVYGWVTSQLIFCHGSGEKTFKIIVSNKFVFQYLRTMLCGRSRSEEEVLKLQYFLVLKRFLDNAIEARKPTNQDI